MSTPSMRPTRTGLATSIFAALLLQACSEGGSSGPTEQPRGIGDSYLFVSVPTFYFGTRDVGTTAVQEIELSNRGGDIYPLRSIRIIGDNADEFSSSIYDNVNLGPSESINVSVAFSPLTDGRKFAELDIDFDTITQVTDADNQNEQLFYKAQAAEADREYASALDDYSQYIDGKPVTVNKRRAAIKMPVLKESEVYGSGDDFELYLSAMDAREQGDTAGALVDLDVLLLVHGDSYIADDALYLRGYIELMDQQNYDAAQATMKRLRQEYPDTTYYDTALYSEGLAHEKLGNTEVARSIFEDLRYKHTGIDTLGVTLPKDNVMSRLWFDRATDALETVNAS